MPRTRREYLRFGAAAATLGVAGCTALAPGSATTGEEVDDWQYDPDDRNDGGGGGTYQGGTVTEAAAVATESADLGMTAGGAADVSNFRDNLAEGYLPLPTDLSHEGLYNEYYFDTGEDEPCNRLFCPSYATAVSADPLSGEIEQYLTVGLNSGLDAASFERKPLDLVVVLDISGSMSAQFDEYYYDRHGNRHEVEEHSGRAKMAIAREAVASLTEHLGEGDRFGVVLFDDEAVVAKPMRAVEETDMDAIRGHIRELEPDGGTNVAAGVEAAGDLLDEYAGTDPSERETRTVVVTDAMPNVGERSESGLRGRLEDDADRSLYATFVGVGVDFNTEIVDAITSVEGANYLSVHSESEFERRLDEEFEYLVTPMAFDLSVTLDADGYELENVYGTTVDETTGEVLRANTLFPSPTRDGETRGGVVLAQVSGEAADADPELTAEWRTRGGRERRATASVEFPAAEPDRFDTTGIRKAVLLTRYANLLRAWMVDERDGTEPTEGVEAPDDERLGRWERRSDDLTVSGAYRERFDEFADHYEREMAALDDDDLGRELELLRDLADGT